MKRLGIGIMLLVAMAAVAWADGVIELGKPAGPSGASGGWTVDGEEIRINANGRYTLRGSTATHRVVVDTGLTATLTLDNVSITRATGSAMEVDGSGSGATVTLHLVGENSLTATGATIETGGVGLQVENAARLQVDGQEGSLTVTGGYYCAGIGGKNSTNSGVITIVSGNITAVGGYGAAGIGGGSFAECGTITITGGSVTAVGGEQSAGIGSGMDNLNNAGVIRISGGVVKAVGGNRAAGIGGGSGNGGAGNITITGGYITAEGAESAAAIGGGGSSVTWGGRGGAGGNISISGGVVLAIGFGDSSAPAAIGGGYAAIAGNINISGGQIFACGQSGAGIGSGAKATGGSINISGGAILTDEIGIGPTIWTGSFAEYSLAPTTITGGNIFATSINTDNFGNAQVMLNRFPVDVTLFRRLAAATAIRTGTLTLEKTTIIQGPTITIADTLYTRDTLQQSVTVNIPLYIRDTTYLTLPGSNDTVYYYLHDTTDLWLIDTLTRELILFLRDTTLIEHPDTTYLQRRDTIRIPAPDARIVYDTIYLHDILDNAAYIILERDLNGNEQRFLASFQKPYTVDNNWQGYVRINNLTPGEEIYIYDAAGKLLTHRQALTTYATFQRNFFLPGTHLVRHAGFYSKFIFN